MSKQLNKLIAKHVRKYMRDNKISAKELSEGCGLSQSEISLLRAGSRAATVDTLLKLRAVGLDILSEI